MQSNIVSNISRFEINKINNNLLFYIPLVVVLLISPLFVGPSWLFTLNLIMIMALFATSMNIQIGFAGMLPLGHGVFLGLGTYSFAILINHAHMLMVPAAILSILIVFVISVLIGFICLRGSNPMSFSFLSIAFNIFASQVFSRWVTVTGGERGLAIPRAPLLSTPSSYFYFTLVIVAICFVLIWIILNSSFAKVMLGLRENEERNQFVGINTKRFQLIVFAISSLFAGIAGILYCMLFNAAYLGSIDLIISLQASMICVLGGTTSFMGPTIGAFIVVILGTKISDIAWQWQAVLGAIVVFCALSFRKGIAGSLPTLWKKIKRAR